MVPMDALYLDHFSIGDEVGVITALSVVVIVTSYDESLTSHERLIFVVEDGGADGFVAC